MRLISLSEAADIVGISTSQMCRHALAKHLPSRVKVVGKQRFRMFKREAVERFKVLPRRPGTKPKRKG